ncbi:hypothetical protein [uncultured Microbulbifer sp.]|uniref:hypothetical protein n=1 Tax=uncultured Microbulbifer sp. TaxID=348147 RepID=UPI00261FC0BD|nr:hypothetical protein [uncultured Microbulbifer sp.]
MHKYRGQAMLEFLIVASFVLVPLVFMIAYLGKTGDVRHRAYESARYAAWETAKTDKTPTEISYELNRRLISQEFVGFDSVRDRTASGTQNAKVSPLYFHTDQNGDYAPLLLINNGQFAQHTHTNSTPDGSAYSARDNFLNNALIDFDLPQNGLVNATINYQLATERNLAQIGSLSPRANNALYTQSWRRLTSNDIKSTLDGAVLGERAFNNGVFDQLANLASTVGFEEWDDFKPGIVERDVVPCSRVFNGGSNRESACE